MDNLKKQIDELITMFTDLNISETLVNVLTEANEKVADKEKLESSEEYNEYLSLSNSFNFEPSSKLVKLKQITTLLLSKLSTDPSIFDTISEINKSYKELYSKEVEEYNNSLLEDTNYIRLQSLREKYNK